MDKKKILLIHTGGTISMSEDVETGAVLTNEENPLTRQTKELNELAHLIVEEPFQLPSPHITQKEMLILRNLIHSYKDKVSGVVITHGTDTLEETAYFLDLTVKGSLPIVVTGAMRSSNEIGSDGLYNLISSIRVAICDEADGKGVLVVLNDEIHTAENVTKTHTSNVSTFQSPQYGPIGIVTKRGVLFHHLPVQHAHFEIEQADKQVMLIKAHAGMDSTLLGAIAQTTCDGLVIEALGQGNLPPAMLPGIKDLLARKIPIIIVSRCFNGIAQDVYGYPGGGKELKELGLIFSNGLNGQKARIKLLIALESRMPFEKLEEMFQL
ncbi:MULTISPECIES: asparaginase [Cytobacillus]|uniref:asparaginase n=2 Tax=Bacillaceae TaxID=186817 RepID=A0A248TM19_9BACI|nr:MULTISPECIES: asparaginase [Cytobacillus]ASV69169.1 L-asparaginase [Cytobacillus kochii]MDQ0183894.1 L-asparaginase [Cytobacillus kochii]MEA1852916.1 asparaginase [Cytobacillus sp. OWB-43]MED1604211.1 asparaginase [Cytobacillus kochii]